MNTRDPRNWMWAQALEMLDRADRLHRHFFEPGAGNAVATWEPPVDVVEASDEYWILVALPGVEPSHTSIAFDGAALLVSGERPLPAECHTGAIRRLEIPYGQFRRRIPLPSGRLELHAQRFENGCLVIGLRRLT